MGTWGEGSFENDAVCDWIYELEECDDLTVVLDALNGVWEEDYLDSDDAVCAIGAAEVLAAAKGAPLPELPDDVTAWLDRVKPVPAPEHYELAGRAIDRILADDSELIALWEHDADWIARVQELKTRVTG